MSPGFFSPVPPPAGGSFGCVGSPPWAPGCSFCWSIAFWTSRACFSVFFGSPCGGGVPFGCWAAFGSCGVVPLSGGGLVLPIGSGVPPCSLIGCLSGGFWGVVPLFGGLADGSFG